MFKLFLFLFLLTLPLAHTELIGDDGANETGIIKQKWPKAVYGFSFSLPKGCEITENGATGLPASGLVLGEEFVFPGPAKFKLPAGTKILQEANAGWDGVSFVLPDGKILKPDKSELLGIEVKSVESQMKLVIPSETESVKQLRKELESIAKERGTAPTLGDFHKLLLNFPAPLTLSEYQTIRSIFIGLQHPLLDLAEIRELRASLRAGLVSLYASWSIENSSQQVASSNNDAIRCSFWMDGDMLRLDESRGPTLEELSRTDARSFDGTVERVYHSELGSSGGAIVHPLIARSQYFNNQNLLWKSKLIDNELDLGTTNSALANLQDRNAYPLEELVEFHGRKCVALMDQDVLYFLDPGMNYAYCGMDTGHFEFDESKGHYVESGNYSTEILDDFQDCGNGLWLPKLVTTTKYVNEQVDRMEIIVVTDLEVNQEIKPQEFAAVIPDGTDVFDGIQNVSYFQGRDRSVSSTLKNSISGRQSWLFLTLIIANVIMIVLLGIYLFLRKKSDNR